MVEYYEYSWFGRPRILDTAMSELPASLVGNPYMFQARRYDDETGLYYVRHRQYDPTTGRFLQLDPMGNWHHGQGNGLSAYGEDARNNADPKGLATVTQQLQLLDKLQRALENCRCKPRTLGDDYDDVLDELQDWYDDVLDEITDASDIEDDALEALLDAVNQVHTAGKDLQSGLESLLEQEGLDPGLREAILSNEKIVKGLGRVQNALSLGKTLSEGDLMEVALALGEQISDKANAPGLSSLLQVYSKAYTATKVWLAEMRYSEEFQDTLDALIHECGGHSTSKGTVEALMNKLDGVFD